MFVKDVKCPFKISKSKHIIKNGDDVCINEYTDFGLCDTYCLFCDFYLDSNHRAHLQKCKRIDK